MSRAALITGGSGGLGMAIARVLGEEGYSLTLIARRPEKLEAAAEELRADGFDVVATPANMTEEDDIKRAVAEHRERRGRLDVLINNAGLGVAQPVADTETKRLDLQLNVNLRAVYLVARECIPMLKEAGAEHRGALVANMSSIAGKYGEAGLAAYSATKAGVVGLTQAMQKELMGDGIKVTALCPGYVATPMTDWVESVIPKETMMVPEDIGEAVRFLIKTSPNCLVPEMVFLRPADVTS